MVHAVLGSELILPTWPNLLHCSRLGRHGSQTSKSPVVSRQTEGGKTIALAAEWAVASKRKKLTGSVRVRTVTLQHEEVVDSPLRAEQVAVERIVLNR